MSIHFWNKQLLIVGLYIFSLIIFGCDEDTEKHVADTGYTSDTNLDSDTTIDTGWDSRFDSLADAIEEDLKITGAPGAAFAVIEDGEIVFAAGFGNKHPESSDDPVQAGTLFRIGSVNKVITAVATLQQVQAGTLSLDEPVTDAIPEYEFAFDQTWAPSILVRHALNHTAGQYDYGEFGSSDDEDLEQRMLWYGQNYFMMSPSGRLWNYSNPNFSLAGWLAQRASGKWYRDYMDEEIFVPLEMDRTYFIGEEVISDGDYASGLTTNWETGIGEAVAQPDSYDSAFMRPAGFAWSNVYDMAAFVNFLMYGNTDVLSDDLRSELFAKQVSTKMYADHEQYGFGLFVNDGFYLNNNYYAETLISHGGDLTGFAADIFLLPNQNFAVIAFANADGAHFGTAIVEALLLADGLPSPSSAPNDMQFDPTSLQDFVGSYLDPLNVGSMEISVEAGNLTVLLPDLDAAGIDYDPVLIPFSPDNFIFEIDGMQMPMTFIRDDQGKPEYVRTRFFVLKAVTGQSALLSLKQSGAFNHEQLKTLLEKARRCPELQLPFFHFKN